MGYISRGCWSDKIVPKKYDSLWSEGVKLVLFMEWQFTVVVKVIKIGVEIQRNAGLQPFWVWNHII